MLQDAFVQGINKARALGFGNGAAFLVVYAFYGFALWYGADLINRHRDSWPGEPYTGGSVVAILNAIFVGAMSLGSAAPQITAVVTGRAAIVPIFETIDRVSKIDPLDTEKGVKPSKVTGRIELKNVSFRYPARPDTLILDNLNLTFEPGTTVALVGESGCGKSTIIQLIERFYDPDSGSVIIDDANDLKDLNVSAWRSYVGLVAQEPVLFAGTVRDNIRYGKPDATDAEIEQAAKDANVWTFVQRLNKGFDTDVGDGGRLLSGGQKQRVAIARALIKNPSILLLDEATSALDNASERVVQAALDRLIKGPSAQSRTTIVIAHRLTTIQDADRIIVMSRGRVVEDGNHAKLMALDGEYARLVRAQEQSTAEEGKLGEGDGEGKQQDGEDEIDPDDIIAANSKLSPATGTRQASRASRVGRGSRGHSRSRAHSQSRSKSKSKAISRVRKSVSANGAATPATAEDAENGTAASHGVATSATIGNTVVADNDAEDAANGTDDERDDQHGDGQDAGVDTDVEQQDGEEEDDGSASKKPEVALNVGLGRLLDDTRPEWAYMMIGSLGAVGEGVCYPMYAILLGTMVDSFYSTVPGKMMKTTEEYAVWFLVLGIAACICSAVRYICLAIAGEHLTLRLRSRVFDKLLHLDLAFHDRPENASGILVTKLATDATLVRNLTVDRFGQVSCLVGNLLTGIVIGFVRSWQMALLMIGLFPLISVSSIVQFSLMEGLGGKSKKIIEKAGQLATENISSIRTVLSFNGQRPLMNMFANALEPCLQIGTKAAHIAGAGVGAGHFLLFGSYAAIFYTGGYLVNKGDIPFENMIQVFFAIEMCSFMIGQTLQMMPDFDKAVVATNDIYAIIDAKRALNPNEEQGCAPDIMTGEVEFKDVYFHYPTRPDVPVLKGLSLKATGRKVLALVGESGCGKSTVFGLVQRFYDPVVPDLEAQREAEIKAAELERELKLKGISLAKYQDMQKSGSTRLPSSLSTSSYIKSASASAAGPSASPSVGLKSLEVIVQNTSNPALGPKEVIPVVNAGKVLIDGIEVSTMRLSHLRRALGVVSQEPILFSGTVAENIAFGVNEGLPESEIVRAAKLAHIHGLIEKRFPEGYQTQVGIRGGHLSGGQKQRIAIARAIARAPTVLLLDEATSALDNASEKLVQAALNGAMKNRTTLVIAHRLSTIRNADAIVVLAEGRVAEGPGTHDELLKLNGLYAKMINAAMSSQSDTIGGPVPAAAAAAGAGALPGFTSSSSLIGVEAPVVTMPSSSPTSSSSSTSHV